MRRPARVLLRLAIAFTAVLVLASAAPAAHAEPDDVARIVALVNATRRSHGLEQLRVDAGLTSMAVRQARSMAEAGRIFHSPNLVAGARAAVPRIRTVGENVGMGPSVEVIHQALLDSPRHYDNIVDRDFNAIGVATVRSGDVLYISQDFGDIGEAAPPVSRVVRAPSSSAPQARVQAAPPDAATMRTMDRFPLMAGVRAP